MSNGVKTRLNFCSLWWTQVSVFTLHKKNYQAGLLCWKSVTSGKGNCQLTKLICHLTSWQGYHSYLWHHRRLALDYNSMKWHESRLWCKFNKLSANYIFGMPYCLYINYKFCSWHAYKWTSIAALHVEDGSLHDGYGSLTDSQSSSRYTTM